MSPSPGQARNEVLRAIGSYTTAVLTMLDEDEPESLAVVRAALQLREAAESGGTGAPVENAANEEDGAPEAEDDEPAEK